MNFMLRNLKLNRFQDKGFTIVELLIVIVVIAILASISIVAYNGIQQRARTISVQSDVANITKALELYKADNGVYPTASTTADAAGCTASSNYSYSYATDGTWLPELVAGRYINKVPIDSTNSCTNGNNFYRYRRLTNGTSTYGCPSASYYELLVTRSSGLGTPPSNASVTPQGCTTNLTASTTTNWRFYVFE